MCSRAPERGRARQAAIEEATDFGPEAATDGHPIDDLMLGGGPKVCANPDLNPAPPVQDVNALTRS